MNRKVEIEINERIDTNDISILFKGKSILMENSMVEIDLNNGQKFKREIRRENKPIQPSPEIINKVKRPSILVEWAYYEDDDGDFLIGLYVNNEFIKTRFRFSPVLIPSSESLIRKIYNMIIKSNSVASKNSYTYMFLSFLLKSLIDKSNEKSDIVFEKLSCSCIEEINKTPVIQSTEYSSLLNTILGFRNSKYMVTDLIQAERSLYSKEKTIQMVDKLFSLSCIHIKKFFDKSQLTDDLYSLIERVKNLENLDRLVKARISIEKRDEFKDLALNGKIVEELIIH